MQKITSAGFEALVIFLSHFL
ncbi:hypothetical protein BB14905_19005 [Bacillus sp. B14905]|nr:hypothetical protein BB14905_19005 [Bacillus sp. B14905]